MKPLSLLENKMREVLNESLEVYYTKNNETNRLREENKQKTIDWIVFQTLAGPIISGIQGHESSNPEYTWTFGGAIWEGEKRCILLRDPICRVCGVRPSIEVHHIRPKHLKGNPEHPRNLIGLCMECHDEVHRIIDMGIKIAIKESLKGVETKRYDVTTLSDWGMED